MKTESNTIQPNYTIEPLRDNIVRVTLYANQSEVEGGYIYDKYVCECLNRPELGAFISDAFDSWVEAFSDKERAEIAAEIRSKRDKLLSETDYIMAVDYPATEARKAVVSAYRQALRDVPEQEGFPYAVVWPDKP